MATTLPYLTSYRKVEDFFKKIAAARQPDAFTHSVLMSLGFKGTNDRPLIRLLTAMGFIDENSKPTPEYARLKNPKQFGRAMADGIRRAYEPLFDNHEGFASLAEEERRGIVAEVSGADTDLLTKINGTLERLLPLADFQVQQPEEEKPKNGQESEHQGKERKEQKVDLEEPSTRAGLRRPEFHYNVQIHLPANGTEESYLHIFNAIKRAFS